MFQSVLLVRPRLGGEEDSEPSGEKSPAPRLREESVAKGVAVCHARALPRVRAGLSAAFLRSRFVPIEPITLEVKCAGTRRAGNPHAACDVAGTGNGTTDLPPGHLPSSRPYYRYQLTDQGLG